MSAQFKNGEPEVNNPKIPPYPNVDKIYQGIKDNLYTFVPKVGKSPAWNCFCVIIDENDDVVKNVVICRICKKILKYNKAATSNLLSHPCVKGKPSSFTADFDLSINDITLDSEVSESEFQQLPKRIKLEHPDEVYPDVDVLEEIPLNKFMENKAAPSTSAHSRSAISPVEKYTHNTWPPPVVRPQQPQHLAECKKQQLQIKSVCHGCQNNCHSGGEAKDDLTPFAEYVMAELRKLSPRSQAKVKNTINNAIFEAQMSAFDEGKI